MRLTTIGTGTVAPSAKRVCAGVLVEFGTVRLLLDCGSGVTHRMAALGIDWMGITHLAITHFHPDHIADIPILIMAWRYGAMPARVAPIEVLGPPGTAKFLERLADAYGQWMREPGYPLTVREIPFGERMALPGGAYLGTYKVPHTEESIAYSLEFGGSRLVYTGDTGFDEGLAEWSAGCKVILSECSLPSVMAVAGHMTPEDCGALGALARPELLALTHFYPPVELEQIAGIVGQYYKGPLALATDGWWTQIEDSACS